MVGEYYPRHDRRDAVPSPQPRNLISDASPVLTPPCWPGHATRPARRGWSSSPSHYYLPTYLPSIYLVPPIYYSTPCICYHATTSSPILSLSCPSHPSPLPPPFLNPPALARVNTTRLSPPPTDQDNQQTSPSTSRSAVPGVAFGQPLPTAPGTWVEAWTPTKQPV